NGRSALGTAVVTHHRGAVVVRVVRRCYRSWGVVEAGTHVQASGLVAALRPDSLVTGPAEVAGSGGSRRGQPVDLLPGVPADIADPELVGARPLGEPERVAQPIGDDPAGVRGPR